MRVLIISLITSLLFFLPINNSGHHYTSEYTLSNLLINSTIPEAWERSNVSVIERYSGVYMVSQDTIINDCICYYKFSNDRSYEIFNQDGSVCKGNFDYKMEWGELILKPSICNYSNSCVDIGIYDKIEKGYIYRIEIEEGNYSKVRLVYEICDNEKTSGTIKEIYLLERISFNTMPEIDTTIEEFTRPAD